MRYLVESRRLPGTIVILAIFGLFVLACADNDFGTERPVQVGESETKIFHFHTHDSDEVLEWYELASATGAMSGDPFFDDPRVDRWITQPASPGQVVIQAIQLPAPNADATLESLEIDPASEHAGDFAIFSGGTTCIPGESLPANQACTLFIGFTPSGLGEHTADITYTVEETDEVYTATVHGLGAEVSIESPEDGAEYMQGQEVVASFTCDAGDADYTCIASGADGEPIDTSEPGNRAFSVGLEPASPYNAISEHVTYAVTELTAACYPLFAGQDTEAGEVCVEEAADTVHVTYHTHEDWLITGSHLALSGDEPGSGEWLANHWQNRPGNPVPGQFPFKDTPASPAGTVSYEIPFEDIGHAAGETLYIGAKASLLSTVDDTTEGAWAAQENPGETRFRDRGNWATYIEHSLN